MPVVEIPDRYYRRDGQVAFEVRCECGRALSAATDKETAIERAWESGHGQHEGKWECDACVEKRINPRMDYVLTEQWAEDHHAPAGVEVHIYTAKKQHFCTRPGCLIRPGQQYIRSTIAPWVYVADDVDEEGRTIGSRNGEWTVGKFHRYGDEHNTDAFNLPHYYRYNAFVGEKGICRCGKREDDPIHVPFDQEIPNVN